MASSSKYSDFPRIENDWYATPAHVVEHLGAHLPEDDFTFMNPCAGLGHGIARIAEQYPQALCTAAFWIPGNGITPPLEQPAPGKIVHGNSWKIGSTLEWPDESVASRIISNPVFDRMWFQRLLQRAFDDGRPSTWLIPLSKYATEYVHKIGGGHIPLVTFAGRVRWFPDTTDNSKEDFVWFTMTPREKTQTILHPRQKRSGKYPFELPFEQNPDLISGYWREKLGLPIPDPDEPKEILRLRPVTRGKK